MKTHLNKRGLAYVWDKIKESFAIKSHTHPDTDAAIAALQATIQNLASRIAALENGSTMQQGIGYWAIGTTFIIGGSSSTDGIGEMAIGTTFEVY